VDAEGVPDVAGVPVADAEGDAVGAGVEAGGVDGPGGLAGDDPDGDRGVGGVVEVGGPDSGPLLGSGGAGGNGIDVPVTAPEEVTPAAGGKAP
jgi:hypothetical protein